MHDLSCLNMLGKKNEKKSSSNFWCTMVKWGVKHVNVNMRCSFKFLKKEERTQIKSLISNKKAYRDWNTAPKSDSYIGAPRINKLVFVKINRAFGHNKENEWTPVTIFYHLISKLELPTCWENSPTQNHNRPLRRGCSFAVKDLAIVQISMGASKNHLTHAGFFQSRQKKCNLPNFCPWHLQCI